MPEDDDAPDVLSFGDDPRHKRPKEDLVRPRGKRTQNPSLCDHTGTLWTDTVLRTVECGKCGAALDPIECLYMVQSYYKEIEWKVEWIREHKRKEREKAEREQARRDARKLSR